MINHNKLNKKQEKDIIRITKIIAYFMEKYNLTNIKFDDVSYIDCDDYFEKVINIKIENECDEEDTFSVTLY